MYMNSQIMVYFKELEQDKRNIICSIAVVFYIFEILYYICLDDIDHKFVVLLNKQFLQFYSRHYYVMCINKYTYFVKLQRPTKV